MPPSRANQNRWRASQGLDSLDLLAYSLQNECSNFDVLELEAAMNPTTLLHPPSSVAVAAGNRLADLPNIGPFMVRRLQSVGVRSVSDLRSLGPRLTYLRLREAWPEDTSEYTLFALHAALQGRPWQDLDAAERKALVGS
jgi:hypothetical protein